MMAWSFRGCLAEANMMDGKNPVRSLKIYATAALTIVYVLYMFANVAFFAAGKWQAYRFFFFSRRVTN
jgi:hypothetical protein